MRTHCVILCIFMVVYTLILCKKKLLPITAPGLFGTELPNQEVTASTSVVRLRSMVAGLNSTYTGICGNVKSGLFLTGMKFTMWIITQTTIRLAISSANLRLTTCQIIGEKYPVNLKCLLLPLSWEKKKQKNGMLHQKALNGTDKMRSTADLVSITKGDQLTVNNAKNPLRVFISLAFVPTPVRQSIVGLISSIILILPVSFVARCSTKANTLSPIAALKPAPNGYGLESNFYRLVKSRLLAAMARGRLFCLGDCFRYALVNFEYSTYKQIAGNYGNA